MSTYHYVEVYLDSFRKDAFEEEFIMGIPDKKAKVGLDKLFSLMRDEATDALIVSIPYPAGFIRVRSLVQARIDAATRQSR